MSRKGLALFAAFILFGSIVMANGLGLGAPLAGGPLVSLPASTFPAMTRIPFYSYAPQDAAVTISDTNLKSALRAALGITGSTPLYKSDLAKLTGGLDLSGKKIKKVEGLQYCENITALNLSNNSISDLPSGFNKLLNLQSLNLDDNSFTKMPDSLFTIPKLASLSMRGNKITKVPDKINSLLLLTTLDLSGNDIDTVSANIQKLTALQYLSLARNKLREDKLPSQVCLLPALEVLDISGNTLDELPAQMVTMPKLTVLDVEGNILDELPAGLGNAPSLQKVYAARNRLKIIESTLLNGRITHLTLDVNRITDLPQGLAGKTFDTFTCEWNFIDMSESSEARKIADSVIAPTARNYLRQLKPMQVSAEFTATTTTVELSWQPLGDGTDGDGTWKVNEYQIYIDKDGSWQNVAGKQGTVAELDKLATHYVVAGLKANTPYKFQVGVEYSLDVNGQKVTHRIYVPVETTTLAEGATAAPTEASTPAPTVEETATADVPATPAATNPPAKAASNTLTIVLIIAAAVLLIGALIFGTMMWSRRSKRY